MAYGNIIGYEPGPSPGAYAFQQADGRKFVAFGAPAEDLKSRIDASQQQLAAVQGNPAITPQAVAQNASGGASGIRTDALPTYANEQEAAAGMAAEDAAQASPAAAPAANMSVAPPQDPRALAQQQVGALLAAPSASAQPAAAPAAPTEQGTLVVRDPKTHQLIYSEPGANPGDPRHTFAVSQGTPATKAGFAPSSMKVTGANTAINPGDVAALRENSIDQKLAYQQAYDLRAESAAEQRGALDAQAQAIAISAREAQERQQQMQAKADDLQAKYDQAKQDYGSSGVDPGRYMRGNWMSAIGMALGALGAGIAKTPNFAQQFVEQQIQNDIRAQEAAIKIKGDRQQTALGDLQRQLGSLDLAKTAYSGIMLSESKRRLEVLANHQQSREMAAQYLQGAAQLDAALQANDVAFRKQAAGNVETEYRYHQATGGSPGGQQPLTIEQARELKGIFPAAKGGAKKEEAAATQDRALKLNHQVGSAAGLVLNPQTDRWEEGPDTMGFGSFVGEKVGIETERHKRVEAALKDYLPVKAHQLGERPPPLGQVETAVHGYMKGRTATTLMHALNEDRDAIRSGTSSPPPASEAAPTEGEE